MNEEDLDDSFQLLLEDGNGSKTKSDASGVSSVLGDSVELVSSASVTFPSSPPSEPIKDAVPIIPSLPVIAKLSTPPAPPAQRLSDIPVKTVLPEDSLPPPASHPAALPLSGPSFPRLAQALSRFYGVYNPENLNKVVMVSVKFADKRNELWQQLSVKYSLSVSASCKLFIELFIDDQPSAISFLFNCAPLFIRDDSIPMRASNWRGLLGWTEDELGKKRELYDSFLKDAGEVDDAIMRDVARTHQECAFFHESSNQQSLKNVLAVFTRVNGVPYVQGMNEVAAILLFTLRQEADSFWIFNEMMAQLREVFIPGSDSTHDGVYSQIDLLMKRLEQLNPSLHRHLYALGFPIETVCLRWITTLLSMELTIPDTLKLWDMLLMSLRTNSLREMSSSVVLGYLACMQDYILDQADLEDCMPFVSTFGKSLHANMDLLVLQIMANYAFEMKLRGKYMPTEFSVIFEKLTDAVQVAKEGLLTFWGKINTT